MPNFLRGRRAELLLSPARSKQFFMHQSASGDFAASRGLTPGGSTFVGKAGDWGNIRIDYPDPYIAFHIKSPTENAGNPMPRLVGTAGELHTDILTNPGPAGVYLGKFRHLGGMFFATPMQSGAGASRAAGVVVYTPYWNHFTIGPWTVGTPRNGAGATLEPHINVCPLGEFEPEDTPGRHLFLATVWRVVDADTDDFALAMYRMSTAALDPLVVDTIALPAYPAGAKPSHSHYVCPLGPGRAIYLQTFHNGAGWEMVPTAPIEPEIRRVEDWGEVSVTGHLSDIDPSVAGVPDEWAGIEYSAHFVKVGPTHIMFAYYQILANATPNVFLSADDGASWAPVVFPPWPLINPELFAISQWAVSDMICFGEGCVLMPIYFEGTAKVGLFYTLDYGATWAQMPLAGIPGWLGLGNYNVLSINYIPVVLRPYVDAADKGELAILYVDFNDPAEPRALYVTTDLGEKWAWRAMVSWTVPETPGDWNNIGEFVGSALKSAPLLPGLPTAMVAV